MQADRSDAFSSLDGFLQAVRAKVTYLYIFDGVADDSLVDRLRRRCGPDEEVILLNVRADQGFLRKTIVDDACLADRLGIAAWGHGTFLILTPDPEKAVRYVRRVVRVREPEVNKQGESPA